MNNVEEQKKRLEQKKNRLAAEETRLKLKERKARTRHLIEVGGLVAKANLDTLPTNTLYGAMLSLNKKLDDNPDIRNSWTIIGKEQLDKEDRATTPVILTFSAQPEKDIRNQIRALGLRWNQFRSEWYGAVTDVTTLKKLLEDYPHDLEILNND